MKGQALVLACLMVLVLAIAVITTVNLGHRIYERERLQNTADAAAYSMATMEARAFNFYAFVNRTHASHYASAMVWQSTLSFTYFTEAFTADAYGLMHTVFASGLLGLVAPPLAAFIDQYLEVYRQLLAAFIGTLRVDDPDRRIGREVIPMYFAMNGLLTGAAEATLQATLQLVQGTADDVVRQNDPDVPSTGARLASGALSACLLSRSHMREAWHGGREPFRALDWRARDDASKVARAKRAMGSVSNATRPAWATRRQISDGVKLPGGLIAALGVRKWGQTKLLSSSDSTDNRIRHFRDPPGSPDGALAQGDVLGSDDLYAIELGPFGCGVNDDPLRCWGDPRYGKNDRDHLPFKLMLKASIWSVPERGESVHHRLVSRFSGGQSNPNGPGAVLPIPDDASNPERALGLNRFTVSFAGLSLHKWVANVRPVRDGNHPWSGVAPFPHFEPGQFAAECRPDAEPSAWRPGPRAQEFNQPSSFVVLEKSTRLKPAELNAQGELEFGFSRTGARLSLASAIGLTAIARAQTYYHRPGNWHEHPTFFNPYWRPRLASVWQGAYANPAVTHLVSQLPEVLKQNPHRVLTH